MKISTNNWLSKILKNQLKTIKKPTFCPNSNSNQSSLQDFLSESGLYSDLVQEIFLIAIP